jgi:hypothetical protein
MVVHSYNPSTQEAKAGGLRIPGQPGLHNELEANLGCTVSPYLKRNFSFFAENFHLASIYIISLTCFWPRKLNICIS